MLDACGVCNGTGKIMDIAGGCCAGVLAANGRCCAAPNVLDDFGVCDGGSSSGELVLSLAVKANAPGKPYSNTLEGTVQSVNLRLA